MKIKSIYLVSVVFLIFLYCSFFTKFDGLENKVHDELWHSPDTTERPYEDIVIVGIDDESLSALGQWPFPRSYHAEVINRISSGKPAVIGVDIVFSEQGRNPDDDKALAEAVKNAGNVVIPVCGMFNNKFRSKNNLEPDGLVEPFPALKDVSVTGHINTFPDELDEVVRTHLSSFKYKGQTVLSFDRQVYDTFLKNGGKAPGGVDAGSYDTGTGLYMDFKYRAGILGHIPYYQVLTGEVDPEYFKGKIVLIGPYSIGLGDDSFRTPHDKKEKMFGVEIHAYAIRNFIDNSFKTEIPKWLNMLIVVFFAIVAYLAFRRLSPLKSTLVFFPAVAAYGALCLYVYMKGYIMWVTYPILLAASIYLVMIIYRYIEEYMERKRVTGVFGRYVAPQVVSEILKNGEEGLRLGGIRREISVLFVDIRGFTPLSEKIQPEEVVGILNDYLDLCARSIFQYGGTLDKFIGDATMAIFNAPLELPDHAFKAVQTAWAMKQGSELLKSRLEEKFGRSVQFGIGINTGYAVVGNIGSKSRMDYTAIGDTVNTAARLESNSKPGQILMSQSTYDLVKDRIEAVCLGEIKVKGKEQGIPVYQLEGVK